MSVATKQYKAIGDDNWKRTDKVNAELFTLTYGALVVQLIKDYEDYGEVNKQLDKMGYNIGTRLIEDFLARTGLQRCQTFVETAEVISKVRPISPSPRPQPWSFSLDLISTPTTTNPPPECLAEVIISQVAFKTFLNITPSISFPSPTAPPPPPPALGGQTLPQPSEFILILDENPLAEFAELPRDAREGGLWFSNVLCGVIRGALEMIQMQVESRFLRDVLKGDETTEIHVRLIRIMDEEQPENDE
ncbi:MAG: transport protein particle 22 kDa subunit [Tremellales sp. Tagirdzhanova-0007]|nr:MAG: transport protein particle 22 kDa subunit [Tremellales sp. Tagirdzhanova-0007]